MASDISNFFASLPGRIEPARLAGIDALVHFHLTGDNACDWHVRILNGSPSVHEGMAESPDVTLTATAQDWLDIAAGKLNGQAAFLTGRLRIQGDMGLAMKLQSILA
jgi:putative sterol carrier protein